MASHVRTAGMNKDYEAIYHDVESTHFWNVSRREFIRLLVDQAKVPKDACILDVGCAGGLLIKELRKAGYKNISGGDISAEAVEKGIERGLDVSEMSVEAIPLPDDSVDVVILSDVIAHVDDKKALSECYRVLKAGGLLLSFCPAHPWLWSSHDAQNNHKRRYTKHDLKEVVRGSGFNIRRVAYWNCLLFPVQATVVLLKKLRNATTSNYNTQPGAANTLLRTVFWLENRLLLSTNLPIGISLFVVAKKTIFPQP